MPEDILDAPVESGLAPPPGVALPPSEVVSDATPLESSVVSESQEPEWSKPIKGIEERFERLEKLLSSDHEARQQAQQQYRQQQQAQQQQQADPEPDVFDDPKGYTAWALRKQQAAYAQFFQQTQQRDFNTRSYYSEQRLKDRNEYDEYQRLVNLNDERNAVRQYLDRNPGVWEELWAHPSPAERIFQIAKDLDLRQPDAFEARVAAEVERRVGERVQEALGRRTPSNRRSPGTIAQIAGTAPTMADAKDPRQMSDDELSKALTARWRENVG